MSRRYLRFLPVLILIFGACNFVNAGTTPTPNEVSTPTNVPSPEATLPPLPGDLGYGNVTGTVTDAATGQPVAGTTVTCVHYSYTSRESDRCNRTTTTDKDGIFLFEKVFFHDTDTITLTVSAPGYQLMEIKQAIFTMPEWKVDISLNDLP